MSIPKLEKHDAVLVVDVQKDFCPGGKLPVEDGDKVVPVLNDWMEAAEAAEATIVVSRDWHPFDHVSFKSRGGPWPVHCVQETEGAEYHPDLRVPGSAIEVLKGTDLDEDAYSPFQDSNLAAKLKDRDITQVWVGGLALEVCVRQTVLDALADGFQAHLIRDATRAIDKKDGGDGDQAVEEMRDAGALVEETG